MFCARRSRLVLAQSGFRLDPRRHVRMLKSLDRPFFEPAGVWLLAAALFLVPLAYSSSLADPFAFVKRSLMLLVVLLLWGLALLAPAAGDRPRLVAPVRTLAIVFLVSAAAACVVSANRGLALWGLLDLTAGFGLFLGTLRFARDIRRDRKSTRLNSSHFVPSRMPSSA